MGCALLGSVRQSTIPAMKELSVMYKLYRELPLFTALYDAMLELMKEDLLPEALVPEIVHAYDKKVMETLKTSKDQYNMIGKLVMYRILHQHYWFILSNVTVYAQPEAGSETTTKKKKVHKLGKKVGKFDKIKLWAYDPIPDSTYVQVNTEGCEGSPYFIEVEKEKKVKKQKPKLEKKKKVLEGYNPLAHTNQLGKKGDIEKQNYSRPMPYNEKLRRSKNLDDATAIASSQLGMVDVLKGKYRKKMTEYPYRCVEPADRRMVDLRVMSGRNIARRQYMVLLRNQDRFLSEMTMAAGGTLALMAHNIHVAEELLQGEEREVVRESYGTRRKNRIEHSTFDTVKDYSVVVEPPRKRVETTSDSSEEEGSDLESSVPQFCVRREVVSIPERLCRPKSRQKLVANYDVESENPRDEGKSQEAVGKGCEDKVVEDEYGFLDDLVDLMDGNNNREEAVTREEANARDEAMTVDEEYVTEQLLHAEVLELFNAQQNLFPALSLTELNQTLATDVDNNNL